MHFVKKHLRHWLYGNKSFKSTPIKELHQCKSILVSILNFKRNSLLSSVNPHISASQVLKKCQCFGDIHGEKLNFTMAPRKVAPLVLEVNSEEDWLELLQTEV